MSFWPSHSSSSFDALFLDFFPHLALQWIWSMCCSRLLCNKLVSHRFGETEIISILTCWSRKSAKWELPLVFRLFQQRLLLVCISRAESQWRINQNQFISEMTKIWTLFSDVSSERTAKQRKFWLIIYLGENWINQFSSDCILWCVISLFD